MAMTPSGSFNGKTLAAAAIPVGGLLLALGLAMSSGPLLLVGGIVHGTGLLLSAPRLFGWLSRRQAAEKANFALVLVLALTLVGLLCYITTRRFARMDWTSRGADQMGRHELHASTIAMLDTIAEPIDATLIYHRTTNPTAQLWRQAVINMLEEFRARNPLLSVREINYATHRGQVQEIAERLGEPQLWPFSVVFESPESHMIVGSSETISSPGEKQAWIFSGEAAFALALERLTVPERPTVYVRTPLMLRPAEGQDRDSLSRAVGALRRERYDVRRLPDSATRVPPDAAALVLAGHQEGITDALVEAIQDYVVFEGGRLLILAAPGESPEAAAAIDRLAGPHLDVRTDAVAVGTVVSPYGQVRALLRTSVGFSQQDHPMAANLQRTSLELARACPLELTESSDPMVETEPVVLMLSTSPTGWGETDLDAALGQGPGTVSYDPEDDIARPVIVGAGLAAPGAGPLGRMGPPEPRRVVIGSTRSFTDSGLRKPEEEANPETGADHLEPNLQLLRNSINWLVREASLPEITPRIIRRKVTPLPADRVLRLHIAFLGLLPLAVVVLGITVWRLRRR
jgi:hypothetical protein